jgi:hypothetical protein
MPRPIAEVVELLTEWLDYAQRGLLSDVFMVGRRPDGEYLEAYEAADLPDMVLEVRGAVIRAQTDVERATPRPPH